MQDYQEIANQLINALRQASQANIASLNVFRENAFEDIANEQNSRGTLYSTSTGYRQIRADTEKFQPAIAKQEQGALQGQIQIKSDLLDTKRKIDAMNASAKELAGITFNDLLT